MKKSKRVQSTADLPLKRYQFQFMYANLPMKFRDRQASLTWNEVFELIREEE